MARGNNGNLLQHTVELALALSLTEKFHEAMYLVATHGMLPYERFDERPTDSSPSAFKQLELALQKASEDSACTDYLPSILRAYRTCNASKLHYPNSMEVARALLTDVSGVVVEVVETKARELDQYYKNTPVKVLNQSWRANDAASLELPDELNRPWLLTLDPMTFVESKFQDDDKLRAEDVSLLHRRFSENASKLPESGAIVISCYSMNPKAQLAFYSSIESHHFSNLRYAETVARGGNRHVAAIAATEPRVSDSAVVEWQNTVEWLEKNSR